MTIGAALGSIGTAAQASGLMPWLVSAAVVGSVGLFGSGFAAGHHWKAVACDNEKLHSQVLAQEHQAAAVAKAQATSDKMWDIGLNLQVDLAAGRTRQKTVIEEVTRDVDAHPDLAACIVPAATQRLRNEQVSDSERIAAGRSMQR